MAPDENKNLIPDHIDRLGLRICSVLMTVGGGLATYYKTLPAPGNTVPSWLAVGLVVVGAITGLIAFTGGGK